MNPRVSRSSRARVEGHRLPDREDRREARDRLPPRRDPERHHEGHPGVSFEPTLDYVVVKVPRFAFEKFPAADTDPDHDHEVGRRGDGDRPQLRDGAAEGAPLAREARLVVPLGRRAGARRTSCSRSPSVPTDGRIVIVQQALRKGATHRAGCSRPPRSTRGSSTRSCSSTRSPTRWPPPTSSMPQCCGSRRSTASATPRSRSCAASAEAEVARAAPRARRPPGLQDRRHLRGGVPGAHAVPLLELRPRDRGRALATARKVVILGSGPNRIGQGVEFDYSCVHASFALSDAGFETIMINCNPETVSTDYDTSDRLYFEPLTLEDVLEVLHAEAQSGELVGVDRAARRPDRARAREGPRSRPACRSSAPAPRRSTSPRSAALFSRILDAAGLLAPRNGTAIDVDGAVAVAEEHRLPGARAPELRARRPRHGDRLRHASRCATTSTGSPAGDHRRPDIAAAGRPVPRRRRSRSTSTRSTTAPSCTSAASWSTSRRPASTPATRAAPCRR